MAPSQAIPKTIAEITPSWLTRALRTGACLNQANIVARAEVPKTHASTDSTVAPS